MSICVSVRVAEGLVMAADSATVLMGYLSPQHKAPSIIQTFEYSNKVCQIGELPVGVMTWGNAAVLDRTVQSLIMECEYEHEELLASHDYNVKAIAETVRTFISQHYDQAYPELPKKRRPPLGLFFGGYEYHQFHSELYTCTFPESEELEVVRPNKSDGSPSFGTNWFGSGEALTRLIKGFDPQVLDDLARRGVDRDIIEAWATKAVGELPLIFDGMPLQDAIDFANYAVQVAIGVCRFRAGPPVCGGQVDIAVITPRKFHWAQRKQWAIKE
ncbi:MAG: hypothetical protein A2Y63_05225 [Candidatus Riflebacteria bacterium RBG_13_59_9]|nr:MAG: hypothetical protein A2Y63_05225 [Candidatus Riflebacteria bacterium RBG_13_59_9]